MFRTNNTHLQDDLFNHYQTMKPSIAKMLEKSWAWSCQDQFSKIVQGI